MNNLFSIHTFRQYFDYFKKTFLLSDKQYAVQRFKERFGYSLDLSDPKSFNEKIQWLKLYDNSPHYHKLVDKYSVREYVNERVGDQYLNTVYGVFTHPNEINLHELPDTFVLRCTHGSGWNVICQDKSLINWNETKRKLNSWIHKNYYYVGRERCYKNIQPRIVCEKFLGSNLIDYKFFCFDGEPKYVVVDIDRYSNHVRNIYNIKWELQPVTFGFMNSDTIIKCPINYSEMLTVAKKLSKGLKFVRIDLYSCNKSVIFGEMTFYPGSGFRKMSPLSYDVRMGKDLQLGMSV